MIVSTALIAESDGITHVVNFDLPHKPEKYVHRLGRTGRAGGVGIALSFRSETVRQADEKRKNRIKREKLLAKVEKTATPASGIAPWQKSCPKCSAVQHVRKTVCGCGHTFTVRARPPTCEGERT